MKINSILYFYYSNIKSTFNAMSMDWLLGIITLLASWVVEDMDQAMHEINSAINGKISRIISE